MKKKKESHTVVLSLKKIYVVFALIRPTISILGKDVKPELPKEMAGYLPTYLNREDAERDWEGYEIKEFEIQTPEVSRCS